MENEKLAKRFNKHTGILWGLIVFIPFGWLIFLDTIINRKNDVIKRGLDPELGIKILHNYMASFTISTIIVMIICVASIKSGGAIYIPNLIAVIFVVIAYISATKKIAKFARGELVPKKKAAKTENDIRKQLEELREQNRKQADTIKKLEKEIKK